MDVFGDLRATDGNLGGIGILVILKKNMNRDVIA